MNSGFELPGNRLRTAASVIAAAGRELIHPSMVGTVPSGFPTLDNYFLRGGWKPEQFVILAARPKVGKSALADAFALNAARSGKHVAIFSLEMSAREWLKRSACALGGVDSDNLDMNRMTPDEEVRLVAALAELKALKEHLRIDDGTDLTPETMCAAIKGQQPKPDLVIVDYLQLMVRSNDRYTEVSNVSRTLKVLAKNLEVPMLVLSQLSRVAASNGKEEKIPQPHHLRESGSLEQDADKVLLMWPSEEAGADADTRPVNLGVALNRQGKVGRMLLKFEGRFTRFTEMRRPTLHMGVEENSEAVAAVDVDGFSS